MVFSSILFLFRFLPVFLAVYLAVPGKMRNVVLLFGSLLFYGWGEPAFLPVMLFSALSDFFLGIWIEKYLKAGKKRRAKAALCSSVLINVLLLAIFKYTGWFPLPIGISFYTFQTMSYTIDVYREEVGAQKNPVDFGAFVIMFPQLVAGPIVKYKTVEPDLRDRKRKAKNLDYGIRRFVIGLGKKVILANQAGIVWELVLGMDAAQRSALSCWLGIMAFAFQIYFDFSGYSDMAIGLGVMMGFHFEENFSYPYTAVSVTDFWRRWHKSLSGWFREYVYIPLGGNKRGLARQIVNIAVVWLLTGIWHGAGYNFVLWGLWYALLLIAEKVWLLGVLEKLPAAVGWCYTTFAMLVGWVFFSIDSMTGIVRYLAGMFGLAHNPAADAAALYELGNYGILFVLCAVCSLPAGAAVWNRLEQKFPKSCMAAGTAALFLIFIISTSYIVEASYNPFLYFRF